MQLSYLDLGPDIGAFEFPKALPPTPTPSPTSMPTVSPTRTAPPPTPAPTTTPIARASATPVPTQQPAPQATPKTTTPSTPIAPLPTKSPEIPTSVGRTGPDNRIADVNDAIASLVKEFRGSQVVAKKMSTLKPTSAVALKKGKGALVASIRKIQQAALVLKNNGFSDDDIPMLSANKLSKLEAASLSVWTVSKNKVAIQRALKILQLRLRLMEKEVQERLVPGN